MPAVAALEAVSIVAPILQGILGQATGGGGNSQGAPEAKPEAQSKPPQSNASDSI